jgi:hypothetical protein
METLKYNNIPETINESLAVIYDWGFSIVVICSRIYLIDGEIQMADQFQTNDEHYFFGKDITLYVINNSVHFKQSHQKNSFLSYLDTVKPINFRFHKDEKYIRYSH